MKHDDIPLDEDELVWSHPSQVLPLVVLVVRDTKRLSFTVRVLQGGGHQILLVVDAVEVAESKRPIIRYTTNRSPEVDDLEALFEQLRCILGRGVHVDTSSGRGRCLIDMDEGDGLALCGTIVFLTRTAATNSFKVKNMFSFIMTSSFCCTHYGQKARPCLLQ